MRDSEREHKWTQLVGAAGGAQVLMLAIYVAAYLQAELDGQDGQDSFHRNLKEAFDRYGAYKEKAGQPRDTICIQ